MDQLLIIWGLAYCAMDDGSKSNNGFYLHTQNFNTYVLELLVRTLKINFNLDCTQSSD
jgi:hypothetical protein